MKIPAPLREDFILIPGEELTEKVHSTAMNISGLVAKEGGKRSTKELIQSHVHRILEMGGQTILNHPNFHYRVSVDDMFGIEGLYLFELYNGHPHVHNEGNESHPSTEEMWDELLTKGMKIFGVSSDDAHHFKKHNIKPDKSNPGRGWVMVKADTLTPDAITQAMLLGDFYASSGVILKTCFKSEHTYSVSIDKEKTQTEVASSYLVGNTKENMTPGFRIQWIGKNGSILKVDEGLNSIYTGKPEHLYLRPKVIYTSKNPNGELREYYAWGQPLFL